MRKITLLTTTTRLIYEGEHSSLTEAIESALQKGIPLDEIDLRHADLRHINLDGVCLRGALFHGADLTGANMSEARFIDCDFSASRMVDACLCYTDIINCNFKYAQFAATDISMATLDFCTFEGWDCFHIDFASAKSLKNLTYSHHSTLCPFATQPTIIKNGSSNVAILDKHMINKDIPYTLDHNTPPMHRDIGTKKDAILG